MHCNHTPHTQEPHDHDAFREYITKPIILKLNAEEEALRADLLDQVLAAGEPLDVRNHPQKAQIEELAKRNILALEEGHLTAIYPVSARPTNKCVYLADGRKGYAMCALDALGFHYTFGQDIRIESVCEACGEALTIELKQGRIVDENQARQIYVLHTDLNKHKQWSCCCCCVMHFFSCRSALKQWVSDQALEDTHFPLDLEEANKVAWLLFSK